MSNPQQCLVAGMWIRCVNPQHIYLYVPSDVWTGRHIRSVCQDQMYMKPWHIYLYVDQMCEPSACLSVAVRRLRCLWTSLTASRLSMWPWIHQCALRLAFSSHTVGWKWDVWYPPHVVMYSISRVDIRQGLLSPWAFPVCLCEQWSTNTLRFILLSYTGWIVRCLYFHIVMYTFHRVDVRRCLTSLCSSSTHRVYVNNDLTNTLRFIHPLTHKVYVRCYTCFMWSCYLLKLLPGWIQIWVDCPSASCLSMWSFFHHTHHGCRTSYITTEGGSEMSYFNVVINTHILTHRVEYIKCLTCLRASHCKLPLWHCPSGTGHVERVYPLSSLCVCLEWLTTGK